MKRKLKAIVWAGSVLVGIVILWQFMSIWEEIDTLDFASSYSLIDLESKVAQLESTVDDLEYEVGELRSKAIRLQSTMDDLESKFDDLESKVEGSYGLEFRVDQLESQMTRLRR